MDIQVDSQKLKELVAENRLLDIENRSLEIDNLKLQTKVMELEEEIKRLNSEWVADPTLKENRPLLPDDDDTKGSDA